MRQDLLPTHPKSPLERIERLERLVFGIGDQLEVMFRLPFDKPEITALLAELRAELEESCPDTFIHP